MSICDRIHQAQRPFSSSGLRWSRKGELGCAVGAILSSNSRGSQFCGWKDGELRQGQADDHRANGNSSNVLVRAGRKAF